MYVHCTAGVYRSPQTVIGYYCLYKKMEVNEAILLVEKKHPISKKNRGNILIKFSIYCTYFFLFFIKSNYNNDSKQRN